MPRAGTTRVHGSGLRTSSFLSGVLPSWVPAGCTQGAAVVSAGEARPPDHTPGCSTHHVCSCATHWTTLPPGYRETQSCLGSHFAAMTPHLQG